MTTRRPRSQRQQGFGLLAFVLGTTIFAFSLIGGYSGIWTKEKQLNELTTKMEYVKRSSAQLAKVYPSLSLRLDSSLGDGYTSEELIEYAQIPIQWNLKIVKSKLLKTVEGYQYRAFAFYLDIPVPGAEPLNVQYFIDTGVMRCGASRDVCDSALYMVQWDSSDLVRSMVLETEARLARVVKKAQLYFKARELQDPERNVSINYFYRPSATCILPGSIDLGCLNDYTMLANIEGSGGMTGTATKVTPSDVAVKLGLSPDEMVTAWNLPLEASNVRDSVTDKPPYTMAFRAVLPGGTTWLTKTAVQQF